MTEASYFGEITNVDEEKIRNVRIILDTGWGELVYLSSN